MTAVAAALATGLSGCVPLLIAATFAASHKHAADRAVDVQRQQYALQVAEFNAKHGTNCVPTKKGIIVYDGSKEVDTAKARNVYDNFHQNEHPAIMI